MKLSDLTLPNNAYNSDDILSRWRWLVGNDSRAIIVTKAGDAFLEKQDRIYFLNLGENRFEKVSDSMNAFQEQLADRNFVSKRFLPQVLADFTNAGHSLGVSQVIGFKVPPTLGGSFDGDNLEATDVSVHFSIFGQIAQKISNLPAGTPIGKITVE